MIGIYLYLKHFTFFGIQAHPDRWILKLVSYIRNHNIFHRKDHCCHPEISKAN